MAEIMSQTTMINTGLATNLMIRKICNFDSSRIRAILNTNNTPTLFVILEAMAQTGALHARYCGDFQRHVFLVKVAHCILPEHLPANEAINLQADIQGKSDRSFSYRIQVQARNDVIMEGDFWFSSIDYDERFNAAVLQQYYRDLWTCLTSVSLTA